MARTLVASDYNAGDKAHFSVSYEFCNIICECDDVELVVPGLDNFVERRFGRFLPSHDGHNVQRDFNRIANAGRKSLGLRNGASVEQTAILGEYDLFVYIAWSPQSLVELSRIEGWRRRSRIAVLYLFELWESTVAADSRYLKLLEEFDHIFLLHKAPISKLARYTDAKVQWLPPAVDCLAAAPAPNAPPRCVDIYSYGNRSAPVHQRLLELTERSNLFYLYDSLSSTDSRVKSWREHRSLIANTVKRSRYFIAFNPASLGGEKSGKIAGEQVLASRLFEGAAGGAVILGSAPDCPEFKEQFPWPDAVIEISPDGSDVGDIIEALDRQDDRIAHLRAASVTGSLLRHDWAYRWETILSKVGLPRLPQLDHRKSVLADLASRSRKTLSSGPALDHELSVLA